MFLQAVLFRAFSGIESLQIFFVRMLGVPWPIRFCLVNCLSDFAVNLNPSLGFIYLERWQIE